MWESRGNLRIGSSVPEAIASGVGRPIPGPCPRDIRWLSQTLAPPRTDATAISPRTARTARGVVGSSRLPPGTLVDANRVLPRGIWLVPLPYRCRDPSSAESGGPDHEAPAVADPSRHRPSVGAVADAAEPRAAGDARLWHHVPRPALATAHTASAPPSRATSNATTTASSGTSPHCPDRGAFEAPSRRPP